MKIIREHGSFHPDPYKNKVHKAIFKPGIVRFVEDTNGKFWGLWVSSGPVKEPKTGPFSSLEAAKRHSIAAMV